MIKLKDILQGYKIIKQKREFDRVAFYEEYYKNLSPSSFSVSRESNKIIIVINEDLDGMESRKSGV